MSTEATTDPTPDKREWYSHVRTGELGYMVKREGALCVKLDRPNQDIVKPYREAEWRRENDHRPLTRQHLALVCFAADRELCRALGMHEQAKRDWLSLTTEQRVAWMDTGPQKPAERARLWATIMKTLKPLAR